MTIDIKIARALLDIKAVGFSLTKPITFKSGIISPVYVDNRRFPFYPDSWKLVIKGFQEILVKQKLEFNVIAGIETAGIPHSAALGYSLGIPSVFVRKATKDHGTKRMVEGGSVKGKQVLLIEDHVTTGESSLAGVRALRSEDAIVEHCLSITSYSFPEEKKHFQDEKVMLHTLTTFPTILDCALEQKYFTYDERLIIEDWFVEPKGWARRHGIQ